MNGMSALVNLLRRLFFLALTAAVVLLLARYVLDYPPVASRDSLSLGRLVRQLTDPVLVRVGGLIGMSGTPGPTSPLPGGLVIALLIFGALVGNVLDRIERLLLRRANARYAAPPAPPSAPPVPPHPAEPAPVAATHAPAIADAAAATINIVRPPDAGGAQRIGRYEILGELGRGAMGVVYKARDPQIGRVVAIKSILGAAGTDPAAEEFKKRFVAEARAAGRMNHPGIMKVHDIVEDSSGRPCLVLEFIDGQTLDHLAAAQRPPLDQGLAIMIQAARALGYAHNQGVIHRDIKPANIMVAADGHTTISDFGIAKIEDAHMTVTGMIMGTPAFMSPEQISGATVDNRSDIFSLGSVLYWLVTGKRPFAGNTFTTVSYNVAHTAPPPVREVDPSLPAGLEAIVARCLAKKPEERYATASALAAELESLRAGLAAGERDKVHAG